MVESERAKLGTGVRFSLTALSVRDCRIFSDCHVPILLDGPGSQILILETRVRIPLGTPGRLADLWYSSGCHASVIEPANLYSPRCSLCPGGRASGYELDWRGSTPRREANPSAPRSHARRPAPVLVARDTSLRSLLPRFDSWQGRRRKGRSQPRLIISTLPVQFRLLHPRRLEASGGSHKAVRGGSNPPVAISFSGCGSIWQSTGSGHRGLEVRILPSRPFQQ
jgi:hypothetical protein